MADLSDLEFVADQAKAFLQERPHTPAELVARLEAAGLRLGDDPADLLFDVLDDDHSPVGDRWVNVPSLLDGMRWWVEVPAETGVELPLVDASIVLAHWPWTSAPLLDAAGEVAGEVRCALLEGGWTLNGPEGWLDAVAGGAAIVTYRRSGISIEPATGVPSIEPSLAAAYRAAFDAEADPVDDPFGDDDSVPFRRAEPDFVLLHALADSPGVCHECTVPPLDVLLAAAGLERQGDWVSVAGTDWQALDAAARYHRLRSMHELDHDDALRLIMLLGACSAVLRGDPTALGDDGEQEGNAFVLAMSLNVPAVGRAFVHESLERGRTEDDLLRFAGALLEHVGDGAGCSGPEVVAAICHDRDGRVDDAIAALERAVRHDPDPVAHTMLAAVAADRGDATEAARLLRAANVRPDDDGPGGVLWAEIEPFVQRPKSMAGRNDPCPCGSGKKYKACHLGREEHPLRDRSAWLYRKATRFVNEHEPSMHAHLAYALVDAAGGNEELLGQVLDTELVYDLSLHEGGQLRTFLDRRRSLLPHDEAELAALWLLADRAVYRVDDHGADWVLLTDVGLDEQVRVEGVRGMRLRTDGYVLARLVPVGSSLVSFFGYVPVPQQLVAELVDVLDEADPREVAAAVGRCFAPDEWHDLDD